MEYIMTPKIVEKLRSRSISIEDCHECFANITGKFLRDTRERNQTTPPTLWFISQTNTGRVLKLCFIYFAETKEIYIKTAYEPNAVEIALYAKTAY